VRFEGEKDLRLYLALNGEMLLSALDTK